MLAILNIIALYNTACFLCALGYQYHHPSKMSNSHPLRPYTAVGEIDHVHILSEHIGALMNGEEYSDVTFIVEKKRFPAHRVILAARCHYFRWGRIFVRLTGSFCADEINIISLWTFQGLIICPLSVTFSVWMLPSTSNHCVQIEKDKYHVTVLFFWPSLNLILKVVSQIQEKGNLRAGKYYCKIVLISQSINGVFLWNIVR